MQATMIRIERNAKMEAAITRCKKVHPRVKRIDGNKVTVTSSHGTYAVTVIRLREGLLLASCNCQAGLRGQVCYHIPAGLAAPQAPASTPVRHSLEGVLIKSQGNRVTIDGWDV